MISLRNGKIAFSRELPRQLAVTVETNTCTTRTIPTAYRTEMKAYNYCTVTYGREVLTNTLQIVLHLSEICFNLLSCLCIILLLGNMRFSSVYAPHQRPRSSAAWPLYVP